MSSQRLSDVIAEYHQARIGRGIAANTRRNERRTLDHLLAAVGNIQLRHLEPRHIDEFMLKMQTKGHAPGTMNVHLSSLKAFFAYARGRRLLPNQSDPLTGQKWFKVPPRPVSYTHLRAHET